VPWCCGTRANNVNIANKAFSLEIFGYVLGKSGEIELLLRICNMLCLLLASSLPVGCDRCVMRSLFREHIVRNRELSGLEFILILILNYFKTIIVE
jgi:hypothetical protein